MTNDAELAIPCRLVTLSLLLGPESGLTTLEDLSAKAIAAGRTTVELQAELFALPRRIILDVVHSLWRKGHIMVGFGDGTLELTDGAREVIATTGSLRDSSVKQENRQFLFEPVTGRIFPADQGSRWAPPGSLRLPLHQVLSETDIPAEELLRAVQTAIRNDRRSKGFRQNVLDVGFRTPTLRPASEVRWLTVQTQVFLDDGNGRVSVRLADERGWNSRSRERMRQHLADLAETQPDHEFVQSLRGRASHQLTPTETAASLLRRMDEGVAALAEIEPAQIELRQDFLADLSRRLSSRIAEIGRAKAAVSVVARAAGHHWAAEDLIQSARHQLVFATPDISYPALSGLLPILRDALERKVHLVFLWGRKDSDALPIRVKTALFDLKARYPSRVLFTDRSARTSACLVIQDNQRAFVGTHSPLNLDTTRDDRRPVGVVVGGVSQNGVLHAPQCVIDLLIWARKSFPYWQLGQRIMIRDDQFSPAPEPHLADLSPTPAPEAPSEELRHDPAARTLWASSWGEHHAVLNDAFQRVLKDDPVVEVLEDGAPQDVVQEALHTASWRLAMIDDSSGQSGSDERFLDALSQRLAAGVRVHLVRPEASGKDKASQPTALKALTERGLQVRDERGGARAAIWDDEVVIGSLPLLGSRRRAQRPSERTAHVGVHLRGATVTAQIAADLGVSIEQDAEAPAVSAPASQLSGATAVALSLLVDAGAERGSARYAATMAERLRQVDNLWEVLDVWERKGVAPKDLRPVVAAAVLQKSKTRDESWHRWVGWLIADAWGRRAFVEASMLGDLLGGDDTMPAAACTAAAAIEFGPLAGALSVAALELDEFGPTAAKAVGAAGGLAETLLQPVPGEGPEVLRLLWDAVPSSWQKLADAAVRYRAEGDGPLPLAVVASELSRTTALSETAENWDELVAEIDRLERLHRFTFASGKFLHRELFTTDGMLSTIRAAASGSPGDFQQMQARLPTHPRRYLDQIVANGGHEAIQWGNQRTFLQIIEDIVRRARSLSSLSDNRPISAEQARELAACVELAGVLAADWDALFSEANGLEHPYNQPLLALLERLDPLVQWQRSQWQRAAEER